MKELQRLIERIHWCDEGIKADGPHILIKAAEEVGEISAELLKFEQTHMRKDRPTEEKVQLIAGIAGRTDLTPEERLERIQDLAKRRSHDLNEFCNEVADGIICLLPLPLYYGATPQQITDAIEAKVVRFEERVRSNQYQIPQGEKNV